VKNTLAIAQREVRAYFATPVGWICMFGFLALSGLFFALFTMLYAEEAANQTFNPYMGNQLNMDEYLVAPFWGNTYIILLFICPGLTMRLFAEDVKNRSMELLLTSPVSTWEIVLGKYLGVMGYITVILACTLHYPLIWFWLGDPDPGVMAASYLAVFLLAGSYCAVGMMFSSFTSNQIVAVVLSFGMLLVLWILGWGSELAGGALAEVLEFASLVNRMEALTKGLVHSKDLIYYFSFIGFFLWVTYQRVEAYRWR
jgi:ABC-2 type transport system permease protein